MRWYVYLLEFLASGLLANGVPHFVQGISGNPFPSPFAKPPGEGDSSPVVNVVWGFANLLAGGVLLCKFWPVGGDAWSGWISVGAGALMLSVMMSLHFGRVRRRRV